MRYIKFSLFLCVPHFCATLYRIFFALDFLQHFMMSFCTRLLCNNALLSVKYVCIFNYILYFSFFFHSASYLFALDFCAALHYLSLLSACGFCGLPLPVYLCTPPSHALDNFINLYLLQLVGCSTSLSISVLRLAKLWTTSST